MAPLYHIVIVVLSAAIAVSLPLTFTFAARWLLVYWASIDNEKLFLVSVEVAVALLLILVLTQARTNWRNRVVSKSARAAGLIHYSARKGVLGQTRTRRLKEQQGFMRDVMIVGSTGFRTLVDPNGDLHTVIQNCRSAKIMLLNPESSGALERVRSIPGAEVTQESLRNQLGETIAFLGALRAAEKRLRLKLYPDPPVWKLAILGDYAWVQHYHPGRDVRAMPEYLFVHSQDPARLYTAFYQDFVTRWNDPAIAECDLLTGELVYRDDTGKEVRREALGATPHDSGVDGSGGTAAVRAERDGF
ncbi:MAG: hypothetical protein HY727_17810 [Candidatus Rokubacteria bacterium]|nr:hypothetical protein [Candidatus Rokubacteria bacterium]